MKNFCIYKIVIFFLFYFATLGFPAKNGIHAPLQLVMEFKPLHHDFFNQTVMLMKLLAKQMNFGYQSSGR